MKSCAGHVDALIERNVAAGMSADEAHYAALRAFGGVAQIAERARDERRSAWGEQVLQDLRYAIQVLRKNPSFTAVAVLTLAFGIGVNASLFTLYNAIALHPLPVREPDELIVVKNPGSPNALRFAYPDYVAYRDGNQVFSGLAAVFEAGAAVADPASAKSDPLLDRDGPGTVRVQFVSENYFSILGADLILGRSFLSEENRAPKSHPLIVLSHLFWERSFQRDPNVLGKTVALSGVSYTVIGVTAPGFVGHVPAPPAGWIPLMMVLSPETIGSHDLGFFSLIGRLRPGVSVNQARADLRLIHERLKSAYPNVRRNKPDALDRGMRFMNLSFDVRSAPIIAPTLLGFGMVLLIACTNVANLLLARGVTRQQEIAVRLTLGASRGRIIRQLLTENLLLCTMGAVLGVALAQWTVAIVLSRLPAEWGHDTGNWRFLQLGLDWHIIACTVVLALAAGVAAGLVPALHASRADLLSALKNEGSAFGRRLSQTRLRNALIVVQVAVSLVLLSAAGLLVRNLLALRHQELGFEPQRVFQSFVGPKVWPKTPQAIATAEREAFEVARTLPGVTAAARAVWGASANRKSGMSVEVHVPSQPSAALEPRRLPYWLVTPGFFETFSIPFQRGRTFGLEEVETGAPVVVLSEAAARRLWPGEEPLGKILAISESAFSAAPKRDAGWREYTVIGVARNARAGALDREEAYVYLPLSPAVTRTRTYLRVAGDSPVALAEIRRLANAAGIEVILARPLSNVLEEEVRPFMMLARISGALGALALAMAAVGLYGVMAFSVNQRVREIGIRVALGATTETVIRLFVRQGMRLVVAGMVIGLGGGALFALLLRKLMFGLGGAFDPIAFGSVTLLLGAVALLACWLPSRRAAKVDPMVALRAE